MFINDTKDYYENIKDPEGGMDDEITVSHLLRHENSFTRDGLPFGVLLAKTLKETGLLNEGAKVLEVGPGLGDLAKNFCREAKPDEYVFMDISPKIINFLKTRFGEGKFDFILGDFLQRKIKRKFDLIICNEVLSDFPTIVDFDTKKPGKGMYKDAKRMMKEYGLRGKGIFSFNYGAIKFLEVSNRILGKNGVIFISEQKTSRFPERIRMFGHNEYTIRMEWLEKAAKKLKLSVIKNGRLTEFLGIKKKKFVSFFSQPELRNLYIFMKRNGLVPEQRAQTIDEFLAANKDFIRTENPENYKKFLEKNACFLTNVTDKFAYMILKKQVQ